MQEIMLTNLLVNLSKHTQNIRFCNINNYTSGRKDKDKLNHFYELKEYKPRHDQEASLAIGINNWTQNILSSH